MGSGLGVIAGVVAETSRDAGDGTDRLTGAARVGTFLTERT